MLMLMLMLLLNADRLINFIWHGTVLWCASEFLQRCPGLPWGMNLMHWMKP
jgi:hypothetical protein